MALSIAVKKNYSKHLKSTPCGSINTKLLHNKFLASCMSKPTLNTLHAIDAESWGSTKPYQTFELYVCNIVNNYQYLY